MNCSNIYPNAVNTFRILSMQAGKTISLMVSNLIRVLAFGLMHSTRAVLFLSATPNYFRKPMRCPKITDKLLLIPARELSAMIRKREVTSEAVITSYISRIQAVNPIINAVVENNFDEALKMAKTVDTMLRTTKLTTDELERKYPLLGLPLSIKESISLEGFSNATGFITSKKIRAKSDATIVTLCKEAGAIPIATTNTPELCLNFETYNYVTGVTRNPYDSRRTTAGSSGGEAALIGSAGSVIGLGSDLYGSIRIPAHFCGVWGHKPSPHAVSTNGHFPNCERNQLWKELFTMGPMTRYASDLTLLMHVIQQKPLPSLNGNKVSLKNIQLYYMENDGGSFLTHAVDSEIVAAMRNLIKHLTAESNCKKIQIDDFKAASDCTLPLLLGLVNDMGAPIETDAMELPRYLVGKSNYTLMTIISLLAKNLPSNYMSNLSKKCIKDLEGIKKRVCELLGNNGVLLYPTNPTPATFHYQSFGKLMDYSYTGIFNFLGLTATQCPLGLNSQGLPIGIQVLAAPGNDGLTLAVAEAIEKVLGGWIPPPFD